MADDKDLPGVMGITDKMSKRWGTGTVVIPAPREVDVIKKKKLELDINGNTVSDAIDEIISKYGKKAKDALYGSDGAFDMTIQVCINGKFFVPYGNHDTPIKEGDNLMFMLLAGGG